MNSPKADSSPYALVARVRPLDPDAYLAYVKDVYYPGLKTMKGFVSLRVLRWTPSRKPDSRLEGKDVEYLRISTWRSRADAEAYFKHPMRKSFSRLLDLATVLAYGGAELELDLGMATPDTD